MSVAVPRISPRYKFSDWQSLLFSVEGDWLKAIAIVEDRIRGRLLQPIQKLLPEQFSGFATIALDCLLLESLHGFKEGRASMGNCTEYESYFRASTHFRRDFPERVAVEFCKNVRNGLIHDSETRHQWFIERSKPAGKIVERDPSGNYTLNRNLFHTALEADFDDWLIQLRSGNANARDKMRSRMDEILVRHA
jgi:hypothetical protein